MLETPNGAMDYRIHNMLSSTPFEPILIKLWVKMYNISMYI